MRSADHTTPPTWMAVVALVAIAILSRLPQLLSPYLIVDGDEAILGLMAKHLSEARAFPVFFYGQNYGLSIVEAAAAAIVFLLAGVGAVQLKAAMLALWIIGIVALFRGLQRVLGIHAAFWTSVLLVLLPAWAVWSMKARGGYVTAFTAFALLLALLFRRTGERGHATWFGGGALVALIFLAQPVWLPGVLPVAIYALAKDRRAAYALLCAAGIATTIAPAKLAASLQPGVIWEPPPLGNQHLLASIPDTIRQAYVSLTGSYYLGFTIAPGTATVAASYICVAAFLALISVQIYRVIARRHDVWTHLFCVGTLLTFLGNWLLVEARDARYMLPLGTLLVLWGAFEVHDWKQRASALARRTLLVTASLVLIGAVSMLEFRNFSYLWPADATARSEERRLRTLVGYLKMHGVTHVFSLHGLFQWQLIFYSEEEILARWTSAEDRHQPYVDAVDRAFRSGGRTAIVGVEGASRAIDGMVKNPESIYRGADKYFVYLDPDAELLRKLQFRFAPPPAAR